MEAKGLMKKGNILKVELEVASQKNTTKPTTILSPLYLICGTTVFQVRVITVFTSDRYSTFISNYVFIRFTKYRSNDNLTYTLTFTSNKLGLTNKRFTSDDSTWRLVNENDNRKYIIDVLVQVDVGHTANAFAPLFDDTNLVDFELRGEDGPVSFHKTVLAACSPVLMTMLGGNWRETAEGHVDVPGTSKKTLQHLKRYMYLHTLPNEELEQLLLLSSYYMMPDLELKCVDRLVSSLTAQNACDLLEFAGKHKVTRLMVAILECAQHRAVDVIEIRAHSLPEEAVQEEEKLEAVVKNNVSDDENDEDDEDV